MSRSWLADSLRPTLPSYETNHVFTLPRTWSFTLFGVSILSIVSSDWPNFLSLIANENVALATSWHEALNQARCYSWLAAPLGTGWLPPFPNLSSFPNCSNFRIFPNPATHSSASKNIILMSMQYAYSNRPPSWPISLIQNYINPP